MRSGDYLYFCSRVHEKRLCSLRFIKHSERAKEVPAHSSIRYVKKMDRLVREPKGKGKGQFQPKPSNPTSNHRYTGQDTKEVKCHVEARPKANTKVHNKASGIEDTPLIPQT